MTQTRAPWGLWALVLLPRLLLCWLVAVHPTICHSADSIGYLALAKNLAAHGRFGSFVGPIWLPETVRVPIYPLFLSPFTRLGEHAPQVVAWLQLLPIGVGTVLLFFQWAARCVDRSAARWAAVVLGSDLVTLFHLPMILSETLFGLLLVVTIGLLWQAVHAERWKTISAAGLACGVLTLTKPITLYFALALCPLWFFRRRARYGVLFLAAAYLLPALWIVRNGRVAGDYSFSTQAGSDLLKYPAASVEALETGVPWAVVYPNLQHQADGRLAPSDTSGRSRAEGRLATRILPAHPILLAEHCSLGVLKILGGNCFIIPMQWLGLQNRTDPMFESVPRWRQNVTILRTHPVILAAGVFYGLFLVILYLLFARGLQKLWWDGRNAEAYLLAIGPLYFVGLASLEGYCRYRLPAMPFLAAGAAFALGRTGARKWQ